MHPLIYDVAVSLDGYISGPDGDISQFAHEGPVVDDYTARLSGYAVALMGRATYEFGYAFGLEPGMNPYPTMESYVFSKTLSLPEDSAVTPVAHDWMARIVHLKANGPGPIYLCGGGDFAGRLLGEGLIDRLILKRAPCVYGTGKALFSGFRFAGPGAGASLNRTDTKAYPDGYVLEHYDVG